MTRNLAFLPLNLLFQENHPFHAKLQFTSLCCVFCRKVLVKSMKHLEKQDCHIYLAIDNLENNSEYRIELNNKLIRVLQCLGCSNQRQTILGEIVVAKHMSTKYLKLNLQQILFQYSDPCQPNTNTPGSTYTLHLVKWKNVRDVLECVSAKFS